jgi:hypothetical protein
MAEFIIRNNLNPNKAIKCTITFRQIVNKGEEGEPVWVVELATKEPHKDGGSIRPAFVHTTSAVTLDKAISNAVAQISEQVDWSPLLTDTRPPFVVYYTPSTDVASITSSVNVGIKDITPAAGIDISTIKMTVNGEDVTNDLEITGDPLDYSVTWRPPLRIYDYYE